MNALSTNTQPDMLAMCAQVAKSGLGGIKTPEAAFALTAMALAEDTNAGDSPVAFIRALGRAQRDFHVINGKPTLKADAMLARFQAAGGKVHWGSYTDTQVTGQFSHPQGGSIEVTWDIGRAQRLGLVKPGSPWVGHPRAMLRARVISEAIRTVFPGVLSGLYTPEEVTDEIAPQAPVIQNPPPAQPTIDVAKSQARAMWTRINGIDPAEAKRLQGKHPTAESFITAATVWLQEREAIVVTDDIPQETI